MSIMVQLNGLVPSTCDVVGYAWCLSHHIDSMFGFNSRVPYCNGRVGDIRVRCAILVTNNEDGSVSCHLEPHVQAHGVEGTQSNHVVRRYIYMQHDCIHTTQFGEAYE